MNSFFVCVTEKSVEETELNTLSCRSLIVVDFINANLHLKCDLLAQRTLNGSTDFLSLSFQIGNIIINCTVCNLYLNHVCIGHCAIFCTNCFYSNRLVRINLNQQNTCRDREISNYLQLITRNHLLFQTNEYIQ